MVRRTLALGVQYSLLPTLSLPDNSASLKLDAAQGTFRWFPFQGVFYLGGGFGYQRLRASIGQPVDGGNLSVVADMSTFFVSPHLLQTGANSVAALIALRFGEATPPRRGFQSRAASPLAVSHPAVRRDSG